jgi:diguanylate cyclase (GGDEF)-like protein
MNFKTCLHTAALLLALLVFPPLTQACENNSRIIQDFYQHIELLEITKLQSTKQQIEDRCSVSSKDIQTHLMFGDLTIADAQNDRDKINSIRNLISQDNILDKSHPYFLWHLYALAQSYYWDGNVKQAISLLSQHKTYFTADPKTTIDVRLLALLSGFFSSAESDLAEEGLHYFNKAELKARQFGSPELILYVNFRNENSKFPNQANDSVVDFEQKKNKWLKLLSATEDSITKAEVLLLAAYNKMEGPEQSFINYKKSIALLQQFGVPRTALEATMLYAAALLEYQKPDEAEAVIGQVLETYKNSIDPRQLTYLYDLGFKALQSAQRFEDALKYKDLYYQSMLDASSKEKKHLDELLAEYKLDEQKQLNEMLAQSLNIADLEKTARTQYLYLLSGIVLLLLISLLLIGFVLYKNNKMKKRLYSMAMVDPLTGAANRRAILEQASRELAVANRTQQNLTIVLADLDHFKLINDQHGHDTGDKVLKAFARIAQSSVRTIDFFGRFGGEEWLFVLPATSAADAENLFNRIAEQLRLLRFGELSGVTFSMGATDLSKGQIELDELIKSADLMLYKAKAAGRDQLAYATEQDEQPLQSNPVCLS